MGESNSNFKVMEEETVVSSQEVFIVDQEKTKFYTEMDMDIPAVSLDYSKC